MVNVSRERLGRDRAPFLPEVVWRSTDGGYVRVDRREDPAAWQDAAGADCPLVTQWDDGASEDPNGLPTCSASMPTMVRDMLEVCDVRPGHRVLEIGTGTGYTAALLKDRVGPTGAVVSVEIDRDLAKSAGARLRAAGVDAEVVCADGLNGWEQGAPYDRVHVTCGIRRIPSVWLRQCPDGVLMMPWGTSASGGRDRLVVLTVANGVARGRVGPELSFMKARSQRRTPWADWPDTGEAAEADLPVTWSEIEASTIDADPFVLGLLVPGITFQTSGRHDDGDGRVLWLERHGTYASIGFGKDHPTTVAGDAEVAADYARAVRWWHNHGRPGPESFGLRVSPAGEYAHVSFTAL